MKNHLLKKAKKELNNFHCIFEGDNIIRVSETNDTKAFAHVMYDDEYSECLILSVAVDYPFCETAIDLTLRLNLIAPVIQAESFFVTKDGDTSWGEEAHKYYELENLSIDDLSPISNTFHSNMNVVIKSVKRNCC